MGISGQRQPTAFSTWMRTGRWPRVEASRSVEVKFNPWHDPRNGQFTFGPGGPRSKADQRSDPTEDLLKVDPSLPPITTIEEADAWRARMLAKYGTLRRHREAIEARYQIYANAVAPRPQSPTEQVVDFYAGEIRGLSDVGKETISGVESLVTRPGPTIRDGVTSALRTVDAIITDDTPTYVYFDRAAKWLANASPGDLGYAVGKIGGNVGLAIAPGAIVSKISTASRLGKAAAIPKGPPKITWVDETPTFTGPSKEIAKAYNDSARGARSNPLTKKGQAPALERTMPNGNKRKVRFDGVDQDSSYGVVMIDRKWSIRMNKKIKDQAKRQSEALSQHHLIGFWEVPTRAEQMRAWKLFKDLGISNIKVRIVKP